MKFVIMLETHCSFVLNLEGPRWASFSNDGNSISQNTTNA